MADLQRKTANLANENDLDLQKWISSSGTISDNQNGTIFKEKIVITTTNYTVKPTANQSAVAGIGVAIYNSNDEFIRREYTASLDKTLTFATTTGDNYFKIIVSTRDTSTESLIKSLSVMANEGSAPLPYEPYSATGWVHSLRKMSTATEAVETPLYSDGSPITAYTIKGNTVQSGTPTPSNPITISGVGNKTANLYTDIIYSANVNTNGSPSAMSGFNLYVAPVEEGKTYRHNGNVCAFFATKPTIGTPSFDGTRSFSNQFTVSTGVKWIAVRYADTATDAMIVQGTSIPSYEPTGYKIPISSGGVTTNIYLGSVASNRQIDKIILDGTENFLKDSDLGNSARYYIDVAGMKGYTTDLLSTHYTQSDTYEVNTIRTYQRLLYFSVNKTVYATVTDFQTFLQQQYAAGTPVTVWFVLGTARTVTVNEPLMKIGDYADTLSNAAQIPTTEGANSITVDTTVQPSEFTATWTGWHNAYVKEKSENLFDGTLQNGYYEDAEGTITGTTSQVYRSFMLNLAAGTYTISFENPINLVRLIKDGTMTVTQDTNITSYTVTSTTDGNIGFSFRLAQSSSTPWDNSDIMLNSGSTALPYAPYWE